jgi:E3 ubiquitin-protein ligase RNF144
MPVEPAVEPAAELPAELPVEPADYTSVAENTISHESTRPRIGSLQRTPSQETLPPAYETLSHTSRRSSLTSRRPTSQTVGSPRKSVTAPPSSNITPGVKRSGTWTASAHNPFSETRNPSLTSPAVSPGVKLQKGRPDRRNTVSSASNRPVAFRAFTDDQEAADATFAQNLHLDDTNSMAREESSVSFLVSPNINPSLSQRTSYTGKRQSATSPQLNSLGSYNPWRDQLEADKAFAQALQQEEYRDIQMERDRLLAYSIANGTAEDGDVELAYFMSRETATLIASTDTVAAGPHTLGPSAQASFNPWGIDSEAIQMQLDWLQAREFERELRAKDTANEANFSEAKRLQAEFDKETQNDEAWEEWKKSNIEECIICGEEQHREELARPCEHGYCDGCLQDGFKAALASRTPFKCCQKALSIGVCLGLSAEFITAYEEMMLELSTPNPMYCCNAQCAKFLPPRVVVGDLGTCEKCRSQTCRHCRRRAHPGTFCREDKETEAVKNLARMKGWKTCPGCNHLIERQSGCLHMVCSRCQTAFCYRCSKRWIDCESTCPDR